MAAKRDILREDFDAILGAGVSWDKLEGATVLIAGAGGMIASYMARTLMHLNDTRRAGVRVLAMARSRAKAEAAFRDLLSRPDFELLVQDACDAVDYEGRIDYIVHAASNTTPRAFTEDPVGTIRGNVLGTDRLLELGRKKKIRGFLYLSTREIYGKPVSDKEFIGEDDYGVLDPVLPRSCYPESKRLSEALCAAARQQYGMNCRIGRIAHTYGPGMALGDGRVVGDFLQSVVQGSDIVMNSAGDAVLALTYIRDTVAGLFKLLLDFECWVANISTEQDIVTVKQLAELLVDEFSERNIRLVCRPEGETAAGYLAHRVALLSTARAGREGFRAAVPLREGLRRTVAYFCAG